MTRDIILTAVALSLSACATLTSADAPRCAGARRPANPYGSVLDPTAAAPAAITGGQCLGLRR